MISERINRMPVSLTMELTRRILTLREEGFNVINLSVGEPDFATPIHIKEAAKKAITDNYSFYSPVGGFAELRKAIADKLLNENNLHYTPSQIVVSNGAKQALGNAVMCLVNKNDEVLVPTPYWIAYAELEGLTECKNIYLKTTIDNNFKVTPEQIEKAISHRTKVFLFCSPSNTSGAVYTRNELEEIAKVIAKYENIYVISHEIYEYINYTGQAHQSIAQFDFIKNRVIIINGTSQNYAMSGWRIGYMAAPEIIAKACIKLQGQYTSGPSSIGQKAAFSAIKHGKEHLTQMVGNYMVRRDLIVSLTARIPHIRFTIPQGATYLFPDVSWYLGKTHKNTVIHNVIDLSRYLLEEAHVATVPGTVYGNHECIRISFANSTQQIEEGMSRITEALAKLSR